jgi:hypothetical protein
MLGNVPVWNLVAFEEFREQQGQTEVTESAWTGPSHALRIDPSKVGNIRRGDWEVVRKETELSIFTLLIVDADGPLPAPFLLVAELSKVDNDAVSGASLHEDQKRSNDMQLALNDHGMIDRTRRTCAHCQRR